MFTLRAGAEAQQISTVREGERGESQKGESQGSKPQANTIR